MPQGRPLSQGMLPGPRDFGSNKHSPLPAWLQCKQLLVVQAFCMGGHSLAVCNAQLCLLSCEGASTAALVHFGGQAQ